jgi:hypothetical protein
MCNSLATSVEHVPPKCLFPEQKDVGADYKKNLITVPSCDAHNLKKSLDDEYILGIIAFHWRNNQLALQQSTTKIERALRRNKRYFDLFFGEGKHQMLFWEGQQLVTGPVDINRFNSSMEKIARGIYFSHFNQKWLGKVDIQPLSLLPIYDKDPNHPIITALAQAIQQMKLICLSQPKHGENPDVFYYQLVQSHPPESTIILMVFYSGFEVIAVLGNGVH